MASRARAEGSAVVAKEGIMCQVDRRGFLATGGVVAAALAGAVGGSRAGAQTRSADGFTFRDLGAGVHFAEGDLVGRGYCNTGWIVLEDYVLVIDATYPSGASQILQGVKAVTDKPIRFAFDTHHHGDHLYGNQVLAGSGATPVAHTGVLEELRRLETGYFGGAPGRWEGEARERPDMAGARLKPPTLLFPNALYFEDGKRRVELLHLGPGHTKGDAYAWLPKERVLFTGDGAVNGPFNFVGDGDVKAWIRTLDEVLKLGPRTVCPGHGPVGDATILEDQQAFFQALWDRVGKDLAKRTPEDARSHIDALRADVQAMPRIARYAGDSRSFADKVAKVYEEITGRKLDLGPRAERRSRNQHARAHGHEGVFPLDRVPFTA